VIGGISRAGVAMDSGAINNGSPAPIFKRLVLRFEPSLPHAMQLAVQLVELLHIELLGLFFEDPSLHHLA
jgi:hypothetical protein